jgi:microcin C transport system permease protein
MTADTTPSEIALPPGTPARERPASAPIRDARILGYRLSPLTARRLRTFRRNRRGYWSLWIFAVIFVITLLSEFIANDRPLIVNLDGHYYFPALFDYTESELGGEFETLADYRDPYMIDLINEKGWMVWPLLPYSYNSVVLDLPASAPTPPSAQNWLGTDDQARDVVARLLYGFRISILFGFVLTAVSTVIGVFAGAVQGYFGGLTDLLFQRFLEIWDSLPLLYVVIILSSIIDPSFWWLLLILLLFQWTWPIGVVRAEFLRARNFEYVRAARALGVRDATIMVRHVLPNAMVATLTFLPFTLAGSVTVLTGLDFLGFGLPPGSPSLGELLLQGKQNLQAPWLGFTGFFTMAIMLTLLVFIGEAVRDAFDPRKLFR